jgi:hypothetical protein
MFGTQFPDWPSARFDPAGSSPNNYSTPTNASGVYVEYGTGRGGDYYTTRRAYFYWDLSSYAPNITAIDMNIELTGVGSPLQIQPAQSTLAFSGNGSAPLQIGEYDITVPSDPPPAYGSTFVNAPGIVTTPLNATAIADANANGFLIIQLVEFDYDYSDIDPTPFGYNVYSAEIRFADGNNTLDVTYTPPGYGNDVNGVTSSNISSVNAVATANISNVIGV